jgi:hypothetical protein
LTSWALRHRASGSRPPGKWCIVVGAVALIAVLYAPTIVAETIGSGGENPTDLFDTLSEGDDIFDGEPVTISGFVWVDVNNNHLKDAGEVGLPNVVILLTSDANPDYKKWTATGSDGSYQFVDLLPGYYSLEQKPPQGFTDGWDKLGEIVVIDPQGGSSSSLPTANPGSAAQDNRFVGIEVPAGAAGINYAFGYKGLSPSQLSKRVYITDIPPPSPPLVPEPGTLTLLGFAGLALCGTAWRRRMRSRRA